MRSVPSSVRSLLVAASIVKRDPQPLIERALSMEEVLILHETSSLDEARSGRVARALDILAAAAGLVLLLPILAIIALLIWLQDRGPVFSVHTLVGLEGRHFRSFKFRSMRTDAHRIRRSLWEMNEPKGGVVYRLKADPRVTPVGRFLRKYAIDELPLLWSVLLGDMTLFGSRRRPRNGRAGLDAPGP